MFYSDVILSRKGKLSKVWLAAHAERRMTKAMILDTNIVSSVSSIINKRNEQDAIPMALRLSGQLLYGVVRIYSRQAKYLLDDCNEALIKLKTAFRAGAVDMTMQSSRSAITLPNRPTVLDLALPDPMFEGWDVNSRAGSVLSSSNGPQSIRSQSYTARLEDISLARLPDPGEESRFSRFDTSDFFDPDAGQDLGLNPVVDETGARRRDSQGREVDANGDVIVAGQEEDEEDGNSSVGLAREGVPQAGRPSLGLGGDLTAGFDDIRGDSIMGADEVGGVDFGLEEFELERQRESTPIGTQSLMQDLTPRTAMKVQQAAEKRAATLGHEKVRKQVIDSRTELLDEFTQVNGANVASLLLARERYLPRSRAYMQLLEFHANPTRHILPYNLTTIQGDLDPQLNELFTFDASILRRRRSPSVDVPQREDRAEKRARREDSVLDDEEGLGDDTSIGLGRRAERENSLLGGDVTGLGGMGDATFDDFGGFAEDMPLDLPAMQMDDATAFDMAGPRRSTRKRATDQGPARAEKPVNTYDQRGDLPRLTTPMSTGEGDGQGSVASDFSPSSSNLLRVFDTSILPEATNLAAETLASTQAGLSKNTVRALKVLRKELSTTTEGEEQGAAAAAADDDDEQKGSFQNITQSATRRAAASFFFELLVLGTKDCIKVEQTESFGDISIQARPNLWLEDSQLNLPAIVE